MTVTTLNVTDMHCAACSNKISKVLKPFAEIQNLQFNPVRRQVFITHTDSLRSAALIEQIECAGFHPQLEQESRPQQREDTALLKRLGIAGLGMMQVMMVQLALYAGAFQGMQDSIRRLLELSALIFCIPVVAYSATPFFRSALSSLRRGLNMDAPIALAVAIAFLVSLTNTLTNQGEVYYDSVVMFTFLMLGARYLEQRLRHRLGVADSLQAALPRYANVITDTDRCEQPLESIKVGSRLWIAEGEQVPLDGTIDSTEALINEVLLDEALLTGEADLARRCQGEQIYAGTLNRGAGFSLMVTSDLANSRVAEIDRLANTAMDAKHKLARLADKVARVFVPAILLLAACTYAVWSVFAPHLALSAGLAVLVVSCPCALSLATPAALAAALTRLRHAGILVRNSQALEVADQITHVYFDKTGTLTNPRPQVTDTRTLGAYSAQTCWQYACALQSHSSHPLAQAFKDAQILPAEDVEIVPGRGLQGYVDTHKVAIGSASWCGLETPANQNPRSTARTTEVDETDGNIVYLSIDNQPAASFQLTVELRADAKDTISALQAGGLRVAMLSGDNQTNCAALAEQVGINFVADSMPEAKPQVLEDAKRTAGAVMYVGDGVNDLPALATADVSVATLETTDLVKSKADVLLLTRRLGALCDFLRVGKRSRLIMRENLAWALAYNLIAIPLAAFGYAPPWAAALGMSVSSLIVMLNATRILNTPLLNTSLPNTPLLKRGEQ